MAEHTASARRAAALTLWAAVGGAKMDEALELMRFASELWPEPPLRFSNDALADTPSAEAWTRARDALAVAQEHQGQRLNTNWDERAKAEKLVAEFRAGLNG